MDNDQRREPIELTYGPFPCRLTHHHHSIAEVKRLQSDLSDAKNKMEAAQEAAQQAERHVASADAQIALALEEKEAALDRVEAVTAARDASIEEMAQLRCEVAHQSALTQEMRDHVAELNRVMKSLKRERKEAQTLAAALQLQVDSLQERLKAEMGRRAVARAAEALRDRSEGRGAGGKEELERQAAQLLAQNAALKATAAKLSHSLAAVMRHAGEAEGADADLIGALHA